MKKTIYRILSIICCIIWIVPGIIAFLLDLVFAYYLYGIAGILIGFTLFPVLIVAMPFVELIAFGSGMSLILSIISFVFTFLYGYFRMKYDDLSNYWE